MAFRAAALARQAGLSGGVAALFTGAGNNFNLVIKNGAAPPADVDTVGVDTTIATIAAADNGASNVTGSMAAPSDDGTTATAGLAVTVGPANAVAAHNFADGNDGIAYAEIFRGTGRTSADKVGDLTIGGPGTVATTDLNSTIDDIQIGTQVSMGTFTFTQT